MNWQIRLILFSMLAVPAFTGYPLGHFETHLLPGLTLGWLCYAVLVHAAAVGLLGLSAYRLALIISLIITLPVVLLGSAISLLALSFRGWPPSALHGILSHYSALAVTMLTVIPLALSIVSVIPFHRMENRLLSGSGGVGLVEKIALMFTRVCNHVVYFVIPDILEVLREERILNQIMGRRTRRGEAKLPLRARARLLVDNMIQVGVEGICSAVRYIPLWAEEIARLPGKSKPAASKPDGDGRSG